jgi:hypothetical protein
MINLKLYCDETGAYVQERSNENGDIQLDNKEQLCCTVQKCEMDSLCLCGYGIIDFLV